MNKKCVILAGLTVVLSSCAAGPRDNSSYGPTGQCSNGNLKFHVGHAYLNVTPRNKCARRGETVTATIQEHGGFTVDMDKVEMAPKQGGNSWLAEKNDSDRLEITFTVPNNQAFADYGYLLKVTGVGQLDPVVRVVED